MARNKIAPRRNASRRESAADRLPTPMEQLMAAATCVGWRGAASDAEGNPLLKGNTPQEAIKECQELAKWLYHTAFYASGEEHGARAVYLMLYSALCGIDRQLEGLFEGARRVTEESRS